MDGELDVAGDGVLAASLALVLLLELEPLVLHVDAALERNEAARQEDLLAEAHVVLDVDLEDVAVAGNVAGGLPLRLERLFDDARLCLVGVEADLAKGVERRGLLAHVGGASVLQLAAVDLDLEAALGRLLGEERLHLVDHVLVETTVGRLADGLEAPLGEAEAVELAHDLGGLVARLLNVVAAELLVGRGVDEAHVRVLDARKVELGREDRDDEDERVGLGQDLGEIDVELLDVALLAVLLDAQEAHVARAMRDGALLGARLVVVDVVLVLAEAEQQARGVHVPLAALPAEADRELAVDVDRHLDLLALLHHDRLDALHLLLLVLLLGLGLLELGLDGLVGDRELAGRDGAQLLLLLGRELVGRLLLGDRLGAHLLAHRHHHAPPRLGHDGLVVLRHEALAQEAHAPPRLQHQCVLALVDKLAAKCRHAPPDLQSDDGRRESHVAAVLEEVRNVLLEEHLGLADLRVLGNIEAQGTNQRIQGTFHITTRQGNLRADYLNNK